MHRSRVLAAVLLAGAATAGLGQNWDVERRLTNNTWFDATAGGTAHAISISGSSIHVVYYHNKGALYGYVVYYTRSTDRGVTWTSLGNACLHGSSHLLSADPTPLMDNGSIVLYFLDLKTLTNDQSTATQRIIYRATSADGVNFDQVQPAYSQNRDVVDPFVLAMLDGTFRMYMAVDPEGIISAVSSDGLLFTREEGVRSRAGGMPGALLLPDGKVRLFLAGAGIASHISSDGLNFTPESGLRIPGPANSIVDNPEPIRLADGSYLMLYQVHDKKLEALPPWERDEIHLATSADGFNWTANPTIIGYGGTSCVVEASDGTLYLYYGH